MEKKPKTPKKASSAKKTSVKSESISASAKESTKSETGNPKVQPEVESGRAPLESLPTLTIRFWEGILGWIKRVMNVDRFNAFSSLAVRIGNWAILVGSVLALLLGLVLAIKMGNFKPFFGGIGFVVLLSVLHYSAVKFIDSGRNFIKSSPSRISTNAFTNSVALISFVGSVVILIGGLTMAVQSESVNIFLRAVPGFFILLFLVWMAVNPELTATGIGSIDSVGEEAISVVSFFMKAILRIVPILFGVLTIWGGVVLMVGLFQSFGDEFAALKSMRTSTFGGVLLLWGAGLPFATFLGYILYYLIIDLIRSILAVPHRFEKQ